jgi:hypothetical protein
MLDYPWELLFSLRNLGRPILVGFCFATLPLKGWSRGIVYMFWDLEITGDVSFQGWLARVGLKIPIAPSLLTAR